MVSLDRLNALQSRITVPFQRERLESDRHKDISSAEYVLTTDCSVAIADVDKAIISLHQSLLLQYLLASSELGT